MAKLIFGLMQSLDRLCLRPRGRTRPADAGRGAHASFQRAAAQPPAASTAGACTRSCAIGTAMRRTRRKRREFAHAWRAKRMGRLAHPQIGRAERDADGGDLETFVKALKADHEGEIEVAGPELAGASPPSAFSMSISSTLSWSSAAAPSSPPPPAPPPRRQRRVRRHGQADLRHRVSRCRQRAIPARRLELAPAQTAAYPRPNRERV